MERGSSSRGAIIAFGCSHTIAATIFPNILLKPLTVTRQLLDYVYTMFGIYTDHVWTMCKMFLECVWTIMLLFLYLENMHPTI